MKKIKEFFGDCYYCRMMNDKLRMVKFKELNHWQKDRRDICPSCRKYLRGNFRYA